MAKVTKKTATVERAADSERPRFKPTYLGAWIEFLGRKQVEIAEKVGMSESQLSLVISGQRKYIQDKLEAIADELGIERGKLFYPPPSAGDDDNDEWISLDGLDDAERTAARNVVKSFRDRPKRRPGGST